MAFYSDEAIVGVIEDFYGAGLYALLINDALDAISGESTLAAVAALELAEGGGYTRKGPITLPGPTKIGGIWVSEAPPQLWTGTGGGFGPFNKIVYICGGTGTVGNSTGYLLTVYNREGGPLTRLSGQEFEHTATFTHTGTVS